MSETESIRSEILALSRNPRRCRERVSTPGPTRRSFAPVPAEGSNKSVKPATVTQKVADWLAACQVSRN